MGEQHPVEAVDPEGVQTPCERLRPTTHVDERRSGAVTDYERVALTDVARCDEPVPRAADRERDLPAAEGARVDDRSPDERDRRGRGDRPGQPPAPRHKTDRDEHERAQPDTDQPIRPRQCCSRKVGRGPGDYGDPRRRHPRDPDHELPDRGRPRQEKAGQAAQDGGDGRGRLGDEIGEDAEERERRRQQDEHRLARELRRQRYGECEGDAAREPARQRRGQRSRQQQQPGRRERGEGEPVVTREPRVVDQQDDHRQSERGQAVGDPAARERDEDHRRHRRSAQHAGPRSHQRDERRKGRTGGHDTGAPPEPDDAREQEDETRDERTVRAGHRGQVTESGGLHRLVQARGDRGLVADRQARQQIAAVARSERRGAREGVPHRGSPGQPRRWEVAHRRSRGRPKGERGRLARPVRPDGRARRDHRAECERANGLRVARHDQGDGHPAGDDAAITGHRRR